MVWAGIGSARDVTERKQWERELKQKSDILQVILDTIDQGTGIGIAPADIPNALSNFGQVENYLTREKQGTGLGLPLATSLAEAHGGTLEIKSELGHGTAATVRFPPERVITRRSAPGRSPKSGAA